MLFHIQDLTPLLPWRKVLKRRLLPPPHLVAYRPLSITDRDFSWLIVTLLIPIYIEFQKAYAFQLSTHVSCLHPPITGFPGNHFVYTAGTSRIEIPNWQLCQSLIFEFRVSLLDWFPKPVLNNPVFFCICQWLEQKRCSFARTLARTEMQIIPFRIRTRVADYISYDHIFSTIVRNHFKHRFNNIS